MHVAELGVQFFYWYDKYNTDNWQTSTKGSEVFLDVIYRNE